MVALLFAAALFKCATQQLAYLQPYQFFQLNYMRPIPLVNYQAQEQQSMSLHHGSEHDRQHNKQYFGVAAFVILVAVVLVFKVFTSYDQDVINGQFYVNQLMSFELIDFWKMTEEKLQQEQSQPKKIIQDNKPHAISREQLGRQSWSLLHMVTGAFPETFDDTLRKKFNTFLVLFGQMYPCKLCANHFMQLLKKQGLFTGNTKKQLMKYLCKLHNKVNQRLGHPIHDCSEVEEQWNTCGCEGKPKTL